MNGLQVMQAIVPQVQNSQPHGNNKNNSTAFLQLLESVLTPFEAHLEVPTIIDNVVNEDLESLLSLMINQLSEREENINEEMLSTPYIAELLEQLPLEMQLEIQDIFTNYSNVSNVIQEQGFLQNPSLLLTLVISFTQLTNESNSLSKKNELDSLIPKLIVQLENLMSDKEKKSQNASFKGNINRDEYALSSFLRATTGSETPASAQVVIPNVQGLPINQIHQFALHVGENQNTQDNAEKLLRQFNNILSKSSLVLFPNGINKLTIKLFPQHLGRLDVTLTQQNGVIIAQLLTTTKAAKSALESQLHQLRQAFLGQNIQVEKIEVHTQQQQQSLLQSNRENQEEQRNNQQRKDQKQHDDGEEKVKFEDLLNEIDAKV